MWQCECVLHTEVLATCGKANAKCGKASGCYRPRAWPVRLTRRLKRQKLPSSSPGHETPAALRPPQPRLKISSEKHQTQTHNYTRYKYLKTPNANTQKHTNTPGHETAATLLPPTIVYNKSWETYNKGKQLKKMLRKGIALNLRSFLGIREIGGQIPGNSHEI